MHSNFMRMLRWLRMKTPGALLLVLGLAGVDLPTAQAQMRYSGGLRPQRSERGNPLRIADLKKDAAPAAAPATITEASYYPDNDFVYEPTSSTQGPSRQRRLSSPDGRSYGVSAATLPWNQTGFQGFDETAETTQQVSVSAPEKYALMATALSQRLTEGRPGAALLIIHLPEHAQLWIEGNRTLLGDKTSYFQSPPLTAGKQYSYTVRVAWPEDSRWVSQTLKVPIEAGLIQTLYLRSAPELLARKKREAEIDAALAKLNAEDRAAARQQCMCVVRPDVRLGEHGVPIKVELNKQTVFLCGEACRKKALADPELALAKAQALRTKKLPAASDK